MPVQLHMNVVLGLVCPAESLSFAQRSSGDVHDLVDVQGFTCTMFGHSFYMWFELT